MNGGIPQGNRGSMNWNGLPAVRQRHEVPFPGYAPPSRSGVPRPERPLDLRDYLKILLRQKWILVLGFFLGATIAAAYCIIATPYYRSSARIEVDEPTRGTVEMRVPARSEEQKEYFPTQAAILKSRELAELIIDRLHLDQLTEFKDDTPEWIAAVKRNAKSFLNALTGREVDADPELAAAGARERLINAVMDRVFVSPVGKTRLILIEVYAKDRIFARTMLQAYIDAYLELHLAKRRSEDSNATQWLKSELSRVKEELSNSRKALAEFAAQHGVVSLEKDLNHIMQGFTSAAQDLFKSKDQLFKLRSFKAQGHLSAPRTTPGMVNMDHLVKAKEQLALLEAEYTHVKTVYSPSWAKSQALKRRIDELKKRIAEMEDEALSAATEAASVEQRLLEQALEKSKSEAMKLSSLEVEYAILKKEVDTNEAVYQMYLQKEKEKEVSAGVTGNNVYVVGPPTIPVRPAKPNRLLSLAVGSCLGLMMGFVWAFYRETSDKSIKSTEEVESYLSLASLGEIPDMKRFKRLDKGYFARSDYGFITHQLPRSPLYDSVRNVQTSLSFLANGRPLRVVAICSAVPQEGKTFVAVALASIMSEDNLKALLIDCDLRRPTVHTIFKTDNIRGLSSLLAEPGAELASATERTFLPGLDIITSGPMPTNPVQLMRSQRMNEILERGRDQYDIVLLDCPPVLGFSEVPILAGYTDGIVFVIKGGDIPRSAHIKAIHSLPRDKVVGAVLNMSQSDLVSYYMRAGKAYGAGRY